MVFAKLFFCKINEKKQENEFQSFDDFNISHVKNRLESVWFFFIIIDHCIK